MWANCFTPPFYLKVIYQNWVIHGGIQLFNHIVNQLKHSTNVYKFKKSHEKHLLGSSINPNMLVPLHDYDPLIGGFDFSDLKNNI